MKLSRNITAILICFLSYQGLIAQPKIKLVPFASGFTAPVCIANAGDSRLFVIEQTGMIMIIDSTGRVRTAPFLDIRDRVKHGGEEGLLGIAFHPDYSGNGFFYVNYTGTGDSSHISRFIVSTANPDSAVASSEMKMLTIPQPYLNHKGGNLRFGPDGYLYIGMGDGGSAGDPGNRAQDSTLLLGKMLRIDVNSGSPYSIPPTNPFINHPTVRPEIWALGLRNPWRFSFDRLTGDLWIGDVGQDLYEEIDFQAAGSSGGQNYGWRCYEGDSTYNISGCRQKELYTFPIFAYSHDTSNGCCILGGYVYRGLLYQNLRGQYLFADYCSDKIWTLNNNSGNWVRNNQGLYTGNKFSTFGESANGEIYIAGLVSGIIYHITDTSEVSVTNHTRESMTIYPDPVSAFLIISSTANPVMPGIVTIFNCSGEKVYTGRIIDTPAKFDLGFLAPGLYFLRAEFRDKIVYRKFIKI